MKKVVLDLHDFSVVNNRLDLMLKLKEHFPNFKVSMFMVPNDIKADWGPWWIREESLKEIKKHLDWIQIIPHGLNHDKREANEWDYETFKNKILPEIKAKFKLDGLPFIDGFCPPHFKWSDGVVKHLDELGWFGSIIREDGKMKPTKRFYRYTHLINEPFWESDLEVLKLHGHVYGTKNDIGLCYENMLKLDKNTIFEYVTEHIETQK